MTAVVVGASSGLGRALSSELARAGHALLLVSSDPRDVEALGADLRLRHRVDVDVLALDLAASADPGRRIAQALAGHASVDMLFLAAGESREDDTLELDASATGALVAVNCYAPVSILQALLARLVAARGVVVVFSSIAAVRGRGRNAVYAASKRALESFAESVRHRYASDALRVHTYRLGFLSTNLTHGLALPAKAVAPAVVARAVVRGLARGSGLRYLPRRFALVAWVVRGLPWFAFRRMRS